MKILDAGTEMLDDRDVLNYIALKRKQHEAEDIDSKHSGLKPAKRPENFLRALKKHEEHLSNPERPFASNPAYDSQGQYLWELMRRLKDLELTKPELLMLVNHRPYRRSQLQPMIEDVESRYTEAQQERIRVAVVEVLGMPEPKEEEGEEEGDQAMEGA